MARIRAAMPKLFPNPEMVEQTRSNTEVLLETIAALIETGSEPRSIELPAAIGEAARSRAQSQVPVASLIRIFRIVHEVVSERALTQLATGPPDPAHQMPAAEMCSSWLFAAFDTIVTDAANIYQSEHERWLRSADAMRAETIDAVLAGNERDTRRASNRLRYELERHHVALIAWLPQAPRGEEAPRVLETIVAQIASQVGADGSMTAPAGQFAILAWLSRSTAFDESRLSSARVPPGEARDARVALGEPGFGLDGFRLSHTEAAHARRVGTLARRGPGTVTRFGQVEVTALSSVDAELAALFVRRALGELTRDDDTSRRVAATLAVYLQENRSRARAAKRLGIHGNTVMYRVRQAEASFGHPVEQDTLRLQVALALLPLVRDRLGGT